MGMSDDQALRGHLIKVLSFDAIAGTFTWRARLDNPAWNARYAGTAAGYLRSDGYMSIKTLRRSISSHRVAFLMVHGYLPNQIDHKNGIPSDNRIDNLRGCRSGSPNCCNRLLSPRNKTGFKGLSKHRASGSWDAKIKYQGRHIHIGTFGTKAEAARAYDRKAKEIHGEFARTNESLGLLPPISEEANNDAGI